MNIISEKHYVYNLSSKHTPALYCNSGDTIIFQTMDCFSNTLIEEDTYLGIDNPNNSNPATGPLFIKEAKVGDALKIEIIDIKIGGIGVNIVGPSVELNHNGITKWKVNRIPVKNSYAIISEEIKIPIEPMIGIIGVAPDENGISTSLPGDHGGNMDCRIIRKGATVYLPVFVDGAFLCIGDLHALMGDGEIGENGLEINGEVKVKISVITSQGIMGPMINEEDTWVTISSKPTLESAAIEATNRMLNILINQVGLKPEIAMTYVNLAGHLKLCQMCNVQKTVRMELKIRKEYCKNKRLF